ncbi:MAG: diaminopimelate decarboxylase [Deltaproteobacteria bacterium]|nr:diaminopimelate decarboxylase [Candidatus Anaeroferrophillus wilburensis]MBN2888673.1 diaminopimelate decarboxylase [Deltaproteobacteria bacterium]
MHTFLYKNDELFCEQVPVAEIARQQGTPFYLYSQETLSRHYQVFDEAFAGIDHLVCYSVKACSNLSVISLFAGFGSGCDVVSGGELFRALKAGVPAAKIVFSGVGKTAAEISAALDAGILMFNVESSQELEAINGIAGKMGRVAPVSIRVNPDVDPQTHPYISTGLSGNKFGVPMAEAMTQFQIAARLPHVEVIGVDCHIGSQLTQVSPFRDAMIRVKLLVESLRRLDMEIRFLDIGGGLGITYDAEVPPLPKEYAEAVIDVLGDLQCTLIMEPGRVLVGNAGIMVTKVLYTKLGATKKFVIVDAGMNDLVRPSLYGAYQNIIPVNRAASGDSADLQPVDVVGPICESGDFLAQDRPLPSVCQGDLLAVMSAGAYGFTMSSNYNSRPRVPEILVTGDHYRVIRQRETFADLIRGELLS